MRSAPAIFQRVVPANHNPERGHLMKIDFKLARQMVGAEFLRLCKKRGLMPLVALIVVAPVTIALGYNAIQHAADPAHHGPAGGLHNFSQALNLLGIFMGPVAAILIGAEAGAGDLAAGVFRDNVVTGRSRTALFLARVPAAVALGVGAAVVGFAIVVAGTFALAGHLSTPNLALVLESAAWVALANAVVCTVAVGLSSLTGSRPATITGLVGWQLVLSPLLLRTHSLGSARDALLDNALLNLRPGPAAGATVIAMSLGIALLVLALWMAIIPTLGAWRMRTRDG